METYREVGLRVRLWHSTDLPAAATDVCLSRCCGLDATVALGLFMTDAVEKGLD